MGGEERGDATVKGNGLDGLFGAENRGTVLKIVGASVLVHGCMAMFVREALCICITSSIVQLCTDRRPQTGGKKKTTTQASQHWFVVETLNDVI